MHRKWKSTNKNGFPFQSYFQSVTRLVVDYNRFLRKWVIVNGLLNNQTFYDIFITPFSRFAHRREEHYSKCLSQGILCTSLTINGSFLCNNMAQLIWIESLNYVLTGMFHRNKLILFHNYRWHEVTSYHSNKHSF